MPTPAPLSTRSYAPSRLLGLLSRRNTSSSAIPSHEERAGFRTAQCLAYDCVQAIAKDVREGMTEKQIADRMGEWLRDHGAHLFLHTPLCWIGSHSRFDGYNERHGEYLPGNRALSASDIFILDVSPVLHGYIGDIGYTTSLTAQPKLDKAMQFLRDLRSEIPALFSTERSADVIWAKVNQRIVDAGYDNCHALYPFRVLGHRVYRIPQWFEELTLPRARFGFLGANWFSTQASLKFLQHGFATELLTPSHRGTLVGMWAIEPHIGGVGFGAKFEELLIVEKGRAFWLDDNVPHMTRTATHEMR